MCDVTEIMKKIPHRYPFLLLDRVLEMEEGKKIVALKNVTINEQFFQGHFPGRPIMPGVLMVEAMAQAGGVLVFKTLKTEHNLIYFMSIDKVKFRKPVLPGDQLRLEVEVLKRKGSVWKFRGETRVGKDLACEAEFMAMSGNE